MVLLITKIVAQRAIISGKSLRALYQLKFRDKAEFQSYGLYSNLDTRSLQNNFNNNITF